MNIEDIFGKLYKMGSTEAGTIGEGLETIWWDNENDQKAKEVALAYLQAIQGWAKKVEEVITGERKEL